MIIRRLILAVSLLLILLSTGCATVNILDQSNEIGAIVQLQQRAETLEENGYLAEAKLFYRAMSEMANGSLQLKAQREIQRIDAEIEDACRRHIAQGKKYEAKKLLTKAKGSYLKALAASPDCLSAWERLTDIEEKIALYTAEKKAQQLKNVYTEQKSAAD